jgi:uncharacterized protein with HEPN domain
MSTPRRDSHYLEDILEAGERIAAYITGHTLESFMESKMVQDAVMRNLQIIGEATKRLSPQLRSDYPDLPWREMSGLRDRIVHDYFGLNHQTIWAVVTQELPQLLPQIEVLADVEAGTVDGEL